MPNVLLEILNCLIPQDKVQGGRPGAARNNPPGKQPGPWAAGTGGGTLPGGEKGRSCLLEEKLLSPKTDFSESLSSALCYSTSGECGVPVLSSGKEPPILLPYPCSLGPFPRGSSNPSGNSIERILLPGSSWSEASALSHHIALGRGCF